MNLCAVVIPFHESALSKIQLDALKHNICCLRNWEIFLTVSSVNKNYAEKLAANFPNVNVVIFDNHYFESINGYNKLLTSNIFYKKFEAFDFILICQTDAIIFSDKLKFWCLKNYSYIGAPWFRGYENPSIPLKFYGVGNGGLSLRKTKDCLKIINENKDKTCFFAYLNAYELNIENTYKYIKQLTKFILRYQIAEDIFWGIGAKFADKSFRIPSFKEAFEFSFETMPSYLYQLNNYNLPFGCHAFTKYEPEFWKLILKEKNISLKEKRKKFHKVD